MEAPIGPRGLCGRHVPISWTRVKIYARGLKRAYHGAFFWFSHLLKLGANWGAHSPNYWPLSCSRSFWTKFHFFYFLPWVTVSWKPSCRFSSSWTTGWRSRKVRPKSKTTRSFEVLKHTALVLGFDWPWILRPSDSMLPTVNELMFFTILFPRIRNKGLFRHSFRIKALIAQIQFYLTLRLFGNQRPKQEIF